MEYKKIKEELQKVVSNVKYFDKKTFDIILKDRKKFLKQVNKEIQTPKPLYDMGVSFIINDIK